MSALGVAFTLFNNTVLTGPPVKTSVVPLPSATVDGGAPFSATLLATLSVERGWHYNFSCDFGGAALGYLHIDGHLICQTGINYPHPPAGRDVISTAYDNPLPVTSSTKWPVRFRVVHNGSVSVASPLSFGVKVVRYRANSSAHGFASQAPLPDNPPSWLEAALTPSLPPAEARRDEMQTRLAEGWGTWYDMSYTKLARLPEGSLLTLALCEPSGGGGGGPQTPSKCATEMRTDWGPNDGVQVSLRPGPHAYDHSYMELSLATPTCNLSLTLGGGAQLLAEIVVVKGCGASELVVLGGSAWQRRHEVRASSSSLAFMPYGTGVRSSIVYTTEEASGALELPAEVAEQPHVAISLGSCRRVGLSSDERRDVDAIHAKLVAARAAELGRYARFGEHAEVKMAVQAGVMWNVVYNPLESGPIAPVIRGNPWGWDMATADDDWPYVLFDWDTHFASYMLSLDAKELGYSVLTQIVKAKTARGFVPNGMAPTRKSTHSQPPVGSKVLLEMWRKHSDVWIVELLFDDLLDWSDWFYAHRRLEPLGLTALGGDDMQAARYESGLDNSPMYDGEFFAPSPGEPYDGLMTLYDVGMASMVAMSDEALGELATVLNRSRDAATLRSRAAETRRKIDANLWDPAYGAFVNRFQNGSFYRRISPTSFYPMLAGAATAGRATALMDGWLLNSSRFCVARAGDFAGNADTCFWGLPSISADDPAFPQLGYWRGFVWGPQALLTYWGLSHPEYAALPAVATARTALCKQMAALFLSQWRRNRHVCENFSPWRNATECTGMHFYHWGALAGFIGLLDAGFYMCMYMCMCMYMHMSCHVRHSLILPTRPKRTTTSIIDRD